MKVLYLAHRIPFPPNKGEKIRAYQELRLLHARGHEVHLAAFADDRTEMQFVADLHEVCASVTVLPLRRTVAAARALAGLAGRQPLSVRFFFSTAMRREVRRLAADVRPDVVLVYSSSMAQYVPQDLVARTIVDLVDADSEKWREYAQVARRPASWLYELEWRRLRTCERRIVKRFAQSVVTTPREAALLDGSPGSARTLHAIPHGVDLGRFRPPRGESWHESVPPEEREFFRDPVPNRLVFTGRMDYYANVDGVRHFVTEIFPIIRAEEPRTQLLIVGSNPSREVAALAACPGVVVTGSVRDVHPYLASSHVCVVPLRIARGIQNKVLEAMACALPIVATPAAVAGLQVVAGRDVLVAADPAPFAAAVTRLLREPQLAVSLGQSARQFVERHYHWESLLQPLIRVLEATAASSPGAPPLLPTSVPAAAVTGGAVPLADAGGSR